MPVRRLALPVLVLLLAGAPPTPAAPRSRSADAQRRIQAWKRAYKAGRVAAKGGDRAEAEAQLRRAAGLALKAPVIAEAAARALRALAELYQGREPEKQEKVLAKLLALEERRPGGALEVEVPLLRQLADLARARGATAEATGYLTQLVEHLPEAGGQDPEGLEALLLELLTPEGGDPERRVAWLERLVRLQATRLARAALVVARSRARLSAALAAAKLGGDAEAMAARAAEGALTRCEAEPGPVATFLKQIAAQEETRDPRAPGPPRWRRLAAALEAPEAGRAEVGALLEQEARILEQLGADERAATLWLLAASPTWGRPEADGRAALRSFKVLVDKLWAAPEIETVERLTAEAVPTARKVLGEADADLGRLLVRLGEARRKQNDDSRAAMAFAEAARSLEAALGGDNQEALTARQDHAQAQQRAGDIGGARDSYLALLDSMKAKHGEGTMMLGPVLQALGDLARTQGDQAGALAFLDELYGIQEANKPYARRAKAITNTQLTKLYSDLGRWQEADHHLSRAKYYGATEEEIGPLREAIRAALR